jgi:hypothetical protein
MPSDRAVQFVDLNLRRDYRYVRIEVASTWAAATAPNYYQKLRIDEMWLGWGHPTAVPPGTGTAYEVEKGTTQGWARVTDCQTCSAGAKVENIGNGPANDVTVTVTSTTDGDQLLTMVGAVSGTRSVLVSVNGGPAIPVSMTGSSPTSPLIARSIPVRLRKHTNTIRFFNPTAYAPDLDKITISPLPR